MNNKTVEYPSMSMAVNKDDLIRQHRKMIDELAAQNERLRRACQLGIDMMAANECDLPKTFETMYEAMNEPESWSLAHVRAEGAENVHNKVSETHAAERKRCNKPNCSWCMGYFSALVDLQEEIDEIRQSAKQSGEQ